MYKNILIPVVLTENTSPTLAIEAATALAAKGASVTVLHVIEELPSYARSYVADDFLEQSRKDVIEKLGLVADSIEGGRPVVVNGHSARSILDFAEENGSDCIVLSSHKPGLQDYFLGGTAAHVVRYAQCAVHVIR